MNARCALSVSLHLISKLWRVSDSGSNPVGFIKHTKCPRWHLDGGVVVCSFQLLSSSVNSVIVMSDVIVLLGGTNATLAIGFVVVSVSMLVG